MNDEAKHLKKCENSKALGVQMLQVDLKQLFIL